MKKISLVVKETTESRIKNDLKVASSVFVITHSKLASPDLSSLRQTLKGAGATVFVAKNSVARRALKDSGLEGLVSLIQGPCGLVFIKEEPVNASRVLCNFIKEHEQLKLEGGFLKDKILDKKDIESIARLPSKDILRAQVVMTLNSPISGLVMVMAQVLRKFIYCLEQIKQKKGNG